MLIVYPIQSENAAVMRVFFLAQLFVGLALVKD